MVQVSTRESIPPAAMLVLEKEDIVQILPQCQSVAVPFSRDDSLTRPKCLEGSAQIRGIGPHIWHS